MNAASSAKPKSTCTAVVNRNGMLTGKMHFKTPTEMETLLKKKDGVKQLKKIPFKTSKKFLIQRKNFRYSYKISHCEKKGKASPLFELIWSTNSSEVIILNITLCK